MADKLDLVYDLVKENRKDVKEIKRDLASVDKKLAVHKTKSGVLGAVGGAGVLGIRELIDMIKASFGGGS